MNSREDSRHNLAFEIAVLHLALGNPEKHMDDLIRAMANHGDVFDYPDTDVVANRMRGIWEDQRTLDPLLLFDQMEKSNEQIDAKTRAELLECHQVGPGTDFQFFLDELINLGFSRKTHRLLAEGQRKLESGVNPKLVLEQFQEVLTGRWFEAEHSSMWDEWDVRRQNVLSNEMMKPKEGALARRWFAGNVGRLSFLGAMATIEYHLRYSRCSLSGLTFFVTDEGNQIVPTNRSRMGNPFVD